MKEKTASTRKKEAFCKRHGNGPIQENGEDTKLGSIGSTTSDQRSVSLISLVNGAEWSTDESRLKEEPE